MTRGTLFGSVVLLPLALAACDGGASATGPETPSSRTGDLAPAAGQPVKTFTPTGAGIGVQDIDTLPRARYRIEYHTAPVMTGTTNVYFIWYGDWAADPTGQAILVDLVSFLGSSPYFNLTRLYPNANGVGPNGALIYAGSAADDYSRGPTLTRSDVADIVTAKIDANALPLDASGIYVVVATPDIHVDGFVSEYCAFHNSVDFTGTSVEFAFIGGAARSPQRCAPQAVGPNGTLGADAMASLLAATLANTVTDPNLNAWYDRLGLEMADKCAWTYGATYLAPNGAQANIKLGPRHYLLQQLWKPSKKSGVCSLSI